MSNFLMRSSSCLWIVLMVLLPLPAVAQDETVPPPRPPLLAPLPQSVDWKMVFSDPKRDQPTPATKKGEHGGVAIDPSKQASGDTYVRAIDVAKSGKLRREVSTWSNNAVTEAWVVGNLNVVELQSKDVAVTPVSMNANASSAVPVDFPLLQWISLRNYQDVEVLGGRKCYVYKATMAVSPAVAGYLLRAPAGGLSMTAYVSVDNGLPIMVQLGDATVSFAFSPGSGTPLALPEIVQRAVTRYQNGQKLLRALPTSP